MTIFKLFNPPHPQNTYTARKTRQFEATKLIYIGRNLSSRKKKENAKNRKKIQELLRLIRSY